jgi:hypothetical protein
VSLQNSERKISGPPVYQHGSKEPSINPKILYKKTVQHNVDNDILTKQCFPRAPREREEDWKLV